MKHKLIGLGSRAGVGKDFSYNWIAAQPEFQPVRRWAFADQLKAHLRQFIIFKYGVCFDPLSPDLTPKNKEIIRPLLVGYGVSKRLQDPEFWVKHLEMFLEHSKWEGLTIVTDVRYENEAKAIQALGGLVVDIENDLEAANDEEFFNSRRVLRLADYKLFNDGTDFFLPGLRETIVNCIQRLN